MVKVCREALRFNDMISKLKQIFSSKEDLNKDEREQFSIAFQKSIEKTRLAISNINAIKDDSKYKRYEYKLDEFKDKVIKELQQ